MSASYDPAADAYISMTAGDSDSAGTGAHTIAVLFKTDPINANAGLVALMASSTQVRQLLADSGELFGTGDFSSGYPNNGVVVNTWYVGIITKPAGSAHYRIHLWPYASDGSGTMQHGEAPDAANHGDGSAITQIRIGLNDVRGNGLIAVVGIWDTDLSTGGTTDAVLDGLKTNLLSVWAALTPDELISLENWNGTTGCTAVVGTSTQDNLIGTVGTGANPPSFDFTLAGGAIDLVVADATQAQTVDNVTLTQVHVLSVADATQAQTVDNIALTQAHTLAVSDALQAQTSDTLALTQQHTLVNADAAQGQTADNITLTQVHSLLVADAVQAQTVDNLALDQGVVLVVADAVQSQMADNVSLTQLHQLGIQSAHQAQRADTIGSLIPQTGAVSGAVTALLDLDGAITTQSTALAGIIE